MAKHKAQCLLKGECVCRGVKPLAVVYKESWPGGHYALEKYPDHEYDLVFYPKQKGAFPSVVATYLRTGSEVQILSAAKDAILSHDGT